MAKKKLTLTSAFQDLEKIVAQLETGEMDLEKATLRYKEGLALIEFLKKRLKKVKNEIKEIKDGD